MEKFQISGSEWRVWTKGEGKPILFVHGFPFDHSMFIPSCFPLLDRFQVILPDLPGFGESRFLEGIGPDKIGMADYADGLAAILDRLKIEKTILCGLSMGGYIAMQFFRRHSERLAGLVFCDTRPTPDSPEAAAGRLRLAESVFQTGVEPLPARMIPNLLSERTRRESPGVVRFVTEMILRQTPSGVAAAARGMAERDDSTEFLKEITVPTLALCGKEDNLSPPNIIRSMAEAVPGAEFLEIDGAAHLPPLESPLLFSGGIRRFAEKVYGDGIAEGEGT